MELKNEQFNILRKISEDSKVTQRQIARDLGYSLGKVNYCLEALKKKGLIKILNFKKNKSKKNYFYYLTPNGFTQKTKNTLRFMKQKIKEYDELQNELENLKK